MSATSATTTGTASPPPDRQPPPSAAQQPASPSHLRRIAAVVVLVPLLAALALWAFAWPAARTAPQDLPLGVAGPATATAQVQKQLEAHEGAFEIHRYADEDAARDAIENRTVYGAVVVTERGPELLTASAASPLVAQSLQQAVARQPGGAPVRTVDVVPAPADDPRGAVLTSSVLPMTLAGIAAGAVVTLLGLRGRRAVAALMGAAAVVGMVAALVAGSWLGAFTGSWWPEAAVLAVSTLAVSAAVAGLAALLGTPGIGLGAFVVMMLGNPFSGASSAPEMLPAPVGTIGQWLPPGAGASLLRSVSFFDGAAASGPALTLAWWSALGLGAVLLGSALKRRKESAPATTEREPALAG
ncbi:ABC transporter permease [Streptomyces sp. Qhu-G9]|uniref:ABC transporter permease n=1 Tax=Streptomyces sp. Qhu-G9 TaxID=3452799 RepID=UPI0022ABE669|nr:ABC transporter permease [Streptomyces aurantiacus]WAU81203.1 ABC transporter permease [Streptomyces aurantiacus]